MTFFQTGFKKYNHNHDASSGKFDSGYNVVAALGAKPEEVANVKGYAKTAFDAIKKVQGSVGYSKDVTVVAHGSDESTGEDGSEGVTQAWYDAPNPGTLAIRGDLENSGHGVGMALATVHEYGHLLDYEKFGDFKINPHTGPISEKDVTGSTAMRRYMENLPSANPKLGDLMDSMIQTKAIWMLNSNVYGMDAATQNYFLNPSEAFARGYSQYIATKAGGTLKSQLNSYRKSGAVGLWDDDDFAPLIPKYDALLGSVGLQAIKKVDGAIHVDGLIGSVKPYRTGPAGAVSKRPKRADVEATLPVHHSAILTDDGVKFTQATKSFYRTGFVKYNHTHGADGRFGSGDGGGTEWTAGLSVQGMGIYGVQAEKMQEDVDTVSANVHASLKKAGVPIIPAKVLGHASSGSNDAMVGWYELNDPGVLHVNAKQNSPEMQQFFVTHEYGHMLDVEHYPSRSKFATGDTTSKVQGVKQAIWDSPQHGKWMYEPDNGYWANPQEEFARAFSQYVTVKSGDLNMVRALKTQTNKQWDHDSFVPISDAFDKLFAGEPGVTPSAPMPKLPDLYSQFQH